MIAGYDHYPTSVPSKESSREMIEELPGNSVLIVHYVLPFSVTDRGALNQITTHDDSIRSRDDWGLAHVSIAICQKRCY